GRIAGTFLTLAATTTITGKGAGAVQVLPTLGGTKSAAYGVNDTGQGAGTSFLGGDTVKHAVRWDNGQVRDLGTLGGTNSDAVAIDASGRVAGYSQLAGDTTSHGFVYENGRMTDLGNFLPTAMSHSGIITGYQMVNSQYGLNMIIDHGRTTLMPIGGY